MAIEKSQNEKFGRKRYSPGAYTLDLSGVENVPLQMNGQPSTFGEIYFKLRDLRVKGSNGWLTHEYITDEGQFCLDGQIGEWPLRASMRELMELVRQGINPHSATWYYYDHDLSRDADESHSFFAVSGDKIVLEASFSSEEPLILKQVANDDSEPIWYSHPYFADALTVYWYRKFYTETMTGQLMVLRADEPVLYFYNRSFRPTTLSEPAKKGDTDTETRRWKSAVAAFVVGALVGLYTAFALSILWGWFVAPIFGGKELGLWQALGLVWTAQLLRGYSNNAAENFRWKALTAAVECCVPEDKREELNDVLREQNKQVVTDLWTSVLGQAAAISITLGLGWVLHTFLVA